MTRAVAPLLALLLGLAPACLAQQGNVGLDQANAGFGAAIESYHFSQPDHTGMHSITLVTLPFAGRVPLGHIAALDVSGAYAHGSVDRADGSTATLQGVTDTQVRLSLRLREDLATITAVALLPTGKEKLSGDEAEVAGVVAADLLPFHISNWGSGGGAGIATAVAHSFGGFGMGASASYMVGRRYDLTNAPTVAYRPGNQLRARIALDAATGLTGKASLQLTYLHSSDDQVDGANLFRSGDRFQAMGSYAFAAGARSSGIAYIGTLHRSRGTFMLATPLDAPAQNLYLAGGGFRLPVGASVLLPSADLRVLRRADGLDQGTLGSVGATAEFRPGGGRVVLLPGLRARLGRVLASAGTSSGFTGFEVSFGARFGGVR